MWLADMKSMSAHIEQAVCCSGFVGVICIGAEDNEFHILYFRLAMLRITVCFRYISLFLMVVSYCVFLIS